jgi:hypothetical protein
MLTEDYDLVVVGNKKLASEHDQQNLHCESLQAEVVQICSNADKRIANLEAKVKSAKAHSIERFQKWTCSKVRGIEQNVC